MKSSFIISFSDSLVTLKSLNASRFSTNVSIPRTFLEKRGGNCPPCPPPLATLLAHCTLVPLCSALAGMVRVSSIVPSSLTLPDLYVSQVDEALAAFH